MTSRLEIERAVLRSTLPPGWRHVMHVLATYVDQDAGGILPQFQPSLTQLARDTGLHRRTIMRHLTGLERLAWVTRQRPDPADARRKHARTHYAIHIGRSPQFPQAGDSMSPDLGTHDRLSRDDTRPELGTPRREARDPRPHQSSRSSRSTGGEIEAIIRAIRIRSGRTASRDWAERIRDQILGARDNIHDPIAYLTRVITTAPPDTYAPTPQPPRFTAEKGFE